MELRRLARPASTGWPRATRSNAGWTAPERPWQAWELTAGFTFVRFHYGARGRGGNYSSSELDEWAGRIEELASEAEVFAYFNNDWKGFAVKNALGLCKRLGVVCYRGAGEPET